MVPNSIYQSEKFFWQKISEYFVIKNLNFCLTSLKPNGSPSEDFAGHPA